MNAAEGRWLRSMAFGVLALLRIPSTRSDAFEGNDAHPCPRPLTRHDRGHQLMNGEPSLLSRRRLSSNAHPDASTAWNTPTQQRRRRA